MEESREDIDPLRAQVREAIAKTEQFFWDYVTEKEQKEPSKRAIKKHARIAKGELGMAYFWKGETVCGFEWEDGFLRLRQITKRTT